MISILMPSRSRPDKCFKTWQDWVLKAHTDTEVILSLDADDPMLDKYTLPVTRIVNHNRSAIDAINNAAKVATGDILIVVSDDTGCPYAWGKTIQKHMHGKCDWVIKTQDGIQDWIITMPVMDRTYYERFGYVYYPEYQHCFADTEFTCVAELTGCLVKMNLSFPHNHYSIGKSEKDYVSERADATFEEGKKLFIERLKSDFELELIERVGQLSDNIYTRWK